MIINTRDKKELGKSLTGVLLNTPLKAYLFIKKNRKGEGERGRREEERKKDKG